MFSYAGFGEKLYIDRYIYHHCHFVAKIKNQPTKVPQKHVYKISSEKASLTKHMYVYKL